MESIRVNNFILSGNSFSLDLEWNFPKSTYGDVTGSDLIIILLTPNSTQDIPDEGTIIDDEIIVARINNKVKITLLVITISIFC